MISNTPDPKSEYYAATRPELRSYLPERYSRVLEIGCGRGGFRAGLSKTAEVWGIEPLAGVAEVARMHLDKILIGTYEEVESQLPDAAFDLVICNDVIEHMADDFAFLYSIRHKMQPGGYLMGSIPNMRNLPVLRALLFNKEWEYQDQGVLDRTHLRFYTIKTFPRLLSRAGFNVERFDGINRHVPSLTWIWRYLLTTRWLDDAQWLQFAFLARIQS